MVMLIVIPSLESYYILFSSYGGKQNRLTGDHIDLSFVTLRAESMVHPWRYFRQILIVEDAIELFDNMLLFVFNCGFAAVERKPHQALESVLVLLD
jgi:hypothetical protein